MQLASVLVISSSNRHLLQTAAVLILQVRKLEFLMAEVVAQGHDCVITIGGIQSNHCRATAVAARSTSQAIVSTTTFSIQMHTAKDTPLAVSRSIRVEPKSNMKHVPEA